MLRDNLLKVREELLDVFHVRNFECFACLIHALEECRLKLWMTTTEV